MKNVVRTVLTLAIDAVLCVAAAAAALFLYSLFGTATGVLAVCAWAPEWWFYSYLFMIPGVAIGAMGAVLLARHGNVLKRKPQELEHAG